MKKALLLLSALLVLAFIGASWVMAQEAPATKEAAPAEQPKAPAVKSETISGTIQMVIADKKLVVFTSSAGTPFNFKVTGATRIKVAGKKAKLADLEGQAGKPATVKFQPLRSGNVAQTVEVTE